MHFFLLCPVLMFCSRPAAQKGLAWCLAKACEGSHSSSDSLQMTQALEPRLPCVHLVDRSVLFADAILSAEPAADALLEASSAEGSGRAPSEGMRVGHCGCDSL